MIIILAISNLSVLLDWQIGLIRFNAEIIKYKYTFTRTSCLWNSLPVSCLPTTLENLIATPIVVFSLLEWFYFKVLSLSPQRFLRFFHSPITPYFLVDLSPCLGASKFKGQTNLCFAKNKMNRRVIQNAGFYFILLFEANKQIFVCTLMDMMLSKPKTLYTNQIIVLTSADSSSLAS